MQPWWSLYYHRQMAIIATNQGALGTAGSELEQSGLGPAASLFHGFSDPTRLAILRHLALGEHRVVDLTEHVGLAQSTVSRHLACLKDCGLVESRADGRASVFSLTHPEALTDLFAAAERLLTLTGDAVSLCPIYGADALENDR